MPYLEERVEQLEKEVQKIKKAKEDRRIQVSTAVCRVYGDYD